MKAWRVFGVLFALLAASIVMGQGRAQELKPDQIFSKVSPSVMVLKADGGKKVGSGFLIGNGLAATTYRLVDGASKVTAKFSSGETFDVSGVVDSDASRNFALVRVKVSGKPVLKPATAQPTVGSSVFVVGSPDGSNFGISDGIVRLVKVVNGTKQIQVSCSSEAGSAGSPVVNSTGEVVGILAQYTADANHPDTAMPISYVMGLDQTLATKPFGQAAANNSVVVHDATQDASQPSQTPAAGSDEDNAEQDLADSIVVMYDAVSLTGLMREEGSVENSFQNGPDSRAGQLFQVLHTSSQLLNFETFKDPAERASCEEVIKVVDSLSDALDDMMQGIDAAKKAGGWTQEARDLDNKGYDLSQKLPFDGSTDKLMKDPAFQKYLPHIFLEAKGLIPDQSGYKLGATIFVLESTYLIDVTPGSLADKLGFKGMENVEEFNGAAPKDIDDLKQMIKRAAGQMVAIKVAPEYGDEQTYQVMVPANLGG